MKIYTSYFAKIKQFPKDSVAISVARYTPSWALCINCDLLSPDSELLQWWKIIEHSSENQRAFEELFTSRVLQKLDADIFLAWLEYVSEGKDVVLCCYEKPSDFCHRKLVSAWLNDAGYNCEELTFS